MAVSFSLIITDRRFHDQYCGMSTITTEAAAADVYSRSMYGS